ncbi:Uncharacterised protein [Actinobaculum suis]|uniref:Uncharacterized protein n=1 Tax=Actinobaculum suis TaxID=1657 RepID=A0A7Z9C9N3_9ACTO|nr:Uncharacterised protein [Actinobaculum suis]
MFSSIDFFPSIDFPLSLAGTHQSVNWMVEGRVVSDAAPPRKSFVSPANLRPEAEWRQFAPPRQCSVALGHLPGGRGANGKHVAVQEQEESESIQNDADAEGELRIASVHKIAGNEWHECGEAVFQDGGR